MNNCMVGNVYTSDMFLQFHRSTTYCPIIGCQREVDNYLIHLKSVHRQTEVGLVKSANTRTLATFTNISSIISSELNKKEEEMLEKKGKVTKPRTCSECGTQTSHLHQHLQRQHPEIFNGNQLFSYFSNNIVIPKDSSLVR